MVEAPTAGGGIELHRAMEHERAAAIFHLLIRLRQYPNARVTIESYEDATIVCSDGDGGELIEDLQCKKIEDSTQSVPSLGMDDWWSAPLTRDELKDWLQATRRGDSSIGRIARDLNRYFTLLAYAEPSKGVRKYIPSGVVSGGFTRSPATVDYFPLNFSFADDPDQNSSFGNPSVRQRIRIVPLGPPQLHTYAAIFLNKFYGVMAGKTFDAFSAVEYLFYAHLPRTPEERTFTLSDIESAIKPFRFGNGKWADVRILMSAEQRMMEAIQPSGLPLVTWSDLDAGRLIKTDMLRAGAEAITQQNFIVIAGYNGCGKTVLCKYLAHTYLASNAGAKCFYLQARPGDELHDELEVFQSRLSQPCLFIIDDAQFSEESVKMIAQAYVDLRLTTSLVAKLVIATTETSYSLARRAGRANPLDGAHHLKFDFLSSATMQQYLMAYFAYRRPNGRTPDSKVISVAGGDLEQVNMGAALVLAHALNPRVINTSAPLSLLSEQVRVAVAQWLASTLQMTREEFNDYGAPVFTVCSLGLPIGPHFSRFIERFVVAGFLIEVNDDLQPAFRLRSEYMSLAWIIAGHNLAFHNRIFRNYAELHNTQTPSMAESLSSYDTGRRTLFFLLENHLELFILEDARNVDLTALATIIAAIFRARPRSASDFVRLCFRRGEAAKPRMIALRGSVEAALRNDVRPLTAFLNAAYRADSIFAETFAASLIDNDVDLYRMITLVRDSSGSLEDIMHFLAASKNCDIRFGVKLAPEFARTREYEEKWTEVVKSDNPALVLRTLNILRGINRRLFINAREKYLTEELTAKWIAKIQNVGTFIDFLGAARQLSPKIASRTLQALIARHKAQITSLVKDATSLTDSTLAITGVSRIDRRIATRLANETFEIFSTQVTKETAYNALGSGLGRMQQATTSKLTANLATYAPIPQIAESMQHENRHFVSLGRTLVRIAELSPDIAAKIAERINYADLYEKIRQDSLMSLSYLTCGLHFALPFDMRPQLLSHVRNNADLSTAFHRSLFNERTLHQVADAISTMASAELSTAEIFRLFNVDEAEFRDFVRQRMDSSLHSYSDLELAHFLFALARLDPAYSVEALATLASSMDAIDHATKHTTHMPSASPSRDRTDIRERLSKRFRNDTKGGHARHFDLAGTGALLQISSAVDDEIAKTLMRKRLPDLTRAFTDKNLGRHSIFLLGLHSVSRAECLRFIESVYTLDRTEILFQLSRNPRELIQFLYAIQLVSISECRRIGTALIREESDSLRDYLETEVDLSELSRWVTTLASIEQLGLLDVRGLAMECAAYDTRLWALIDSTQAMLAVGVPDTATTFVSAILENVNQIRTVGKLSHCIQLWLKTDYISRRLRRPNIISQLTGAMLPRALDLMTRETDELCVAFAIGLWLNREWTSRAQHEQLQEYRSYQIKRLQLVEPLSVKSVLAATLLRSPQDDIAALLSRVARDGRPPWMSGLLQVVLDGCGYGGLHVASEKTLVDPDLSSLKYGLSCYAQRRKGCSISEVQIKELTLRNLDESSSAIRFLLRPDCDFGSLEDSSYYIWVYLRRTILTLNYLDWEREVFRTSSGAKLIRTRVSPSPEPILHAAD